MSELTRIDSPALERLDRETFAGLGCLEHGIVILNCAESWATRERGFLEIPAQSGPFRVRMEHDEREAPYALAPDGSEDATLLGSLTSITAATWITIFNIALLLVGFVFLGKSTGVRTVFCTLLYTGLTQLLEFLFPMKGPLTDQPLLELVYAMLLTSIGSAMIFFRQGSSGGTDIIALILKKYLSLNVGKALLCTDAIIALSSFLVFDVRTGLFSVLGLFAHAFLVDGIIESLDSCKCFMIVTSKPDEIIDFIIGTMHHSATLVEAKGAYSHDNKFLIYTVCRRIEAIRLQREIRQVDKGAFITITTSSEIIGRGFRGV